MLDYQGSINNWRQK